MRAFKGCGAFRGFLGALFVALLVFLVLERDAVARFVVATAAGIVTHTRISFVQMRLSNGQITLRDITVRSRAGEPIADIGRLAIAGDLHELLHGGARRFSLRRRRAC